MRYCSALKLSCAKHGLLSVQGANRSAADEFAQRASVRLGAGGGRQPLSSEEEEGQQLIAGAVSVHDAGFGRAGSPMGFDQMRGDPETGLGPGNSAAVHDLAGLHSAGSGGAAGLGTSMQDRIPWGHHRYCISEPTALHPCTHCDPVAVPNPIPNPNPNHGNPDT
jgi:hypothetical protein